MGLAGDTLIKMFDGSEKELKNIIVGDKILSTDLKNNKEVEEIVMWFGVRRKNSHLYNINGLRGEEDHLLSMPGNEFFVDLSRAKIIRTYNGVRKSVIIDELEYEDVYDIRLSKYHVYWANDILVHNCN